VLRGRAASLRQLARAMSAAEVVSLRRRAESDVWIGPTATRCHDELTELGRRILRAADDLVRHAHALERRALELEAVSPNAAIR
jgi:hypothetical protein